MKKVDEAGQPGAQVIVLSSDQLGLAPQRWYCVSGSGIAMLCDSMADALGEAEKQQRDYPRSGPYRAMILGDVAAERERCASICAAKGEAKRLIYESTEEEHDKGASLMANWLARVIRGQA